MGRTAVRERAAKDLEANYDQLLALLKDSMTAKKMYNSYCTKCRSSVKVEVTDVTAAVKAAEFFRDLGVGRAANERSEEARVNVAPADRGALVGLLRAAPTEPGDLARTPG